MTEQQPSGLEGQIQQLERELAQKRAELGSDAGAPYERAEVHAAVGEQIRQAVPGYQPQASQSAATQMSYPSFSSTVQSLVNVAFSQSLQEAIAQALKTGNPAIVDALHDILSDQFHQELLNRNKLEPAP